MQIHSHACNAAKNIRSSKEANTHADLKGGFNVFWALPHRIKSTDHSL